MSDRRPSHAAVAPSRRSTPEATFAVAHGGRLVHISEVLPGRACDCLCAACGRRVVARQGTQKAWHFAHDGETSCGTAAETALHLALKQVIADGAMIAVPELAVEASATADGLTRSAVRRLPARRVAYTNPRLEVRVGDLVADAMVSIGGRDLVVEVAVTHRVDGEKRGKIAVLGLSALELHASRMVREASWDTLRAFVEDSFDDRIWLHNVRKPVQRELAYLDALRLAKNAARQALRWRMPGSGGPVPTQGTAQTPTEKFFSLWSRYGSGELVTVELDFTALKYVARWSEADAAGDPSAYFDLLVEWVRNGTGSIVVTRSA